jgi:aspartyl-tRNA(Asn)/glutamyl-tRNA(Gln) amidotransferase subunit C
MKIDDLRETARLAHLNLSDDELAGAFPAFEQMLGFFAAMQAADADAGAFAVPVSPAAAGPASGAAEGGAAGASRAVGADFFRPDAPIRSYAPVSPHPENQTLNLLNNAGERDGRFIVVPNVL